MRRSNAPSNTNEPAKRAKFATPWAKQRENNEQCEIVTKTKGMPITSNLGHTPFTPADSVPPIDGSPIGHTSNLLSVLKSIRDKSENKIPCQNSASTHSVSIKPFTKPLIPLDSNHACTSTLTRLVQDKNSSASSITCQSGFNNKSIGSYYRVMWCKLSKKKHKVWEEDAILITKEKTAILKDMEGKEIGKSSGYKSSELSGLIEGSTLCIGGKEIEIMSRINEEEWSSGRCFNESSSVSTSNNTSSFHSGTVTGNVRKGFVDPMKNTNTKQTKSSHMYRPLHNPTTLGALVLPKPSSQHQLLYNHNGLPCVDVVVDPRLSKHLRPHQREGVIFLYECIMQMKDYTGQGAILADEMGLGKSLQCITLIWTLLKQGPYGGKPIIRRVIVVTPGSLVKNWQKEFQKWLGTERLNVFAASTDKRPEDFIRSPIYPVLIISYELFMRHFDDLLKVKFDMVVCDEGHRLKNASIKTSSVLSSLQILKRIVLSGTPIQNDLIEFYSIVEFCNPGVLGSLASFKKIYEIPIVRSHQPIATEEERQLGQNRAVELNRLTSLFCLRRTQEVNNQYLPPKVENIVFCRPSPLQCTVYRKLLSSRLLRSCLYGSSNGDTAPHLVCIGALKKLCNCPSLVYTNANDSRGQDLLYDGIIDCYPLHYTPSECLVQHSGKLWVLAAMLEYLKGQQKRNNIVLISNYTQTLNILQSLCEINGYKFLRLDGQTPSNKRMELVERFNRTTSQEFVFLLSSKAGGVGLNLVGASHLILYDIDWNPANDLQAMARVWRDGQLNTVHIYRLLTTGTIEEKIFQRQVSKQGLSGVMDGGNHTSNNVRFSIEELKDLFTLNESSGCVTHDQLGCDCNGLLLSPSEDDSDCIEGEECSLDQSRACALGRNNDKTHPVKNLSIDKLKKWRHIGPPFTAASLKDDLLLHGAENITFIMQNEVQTDILT